MRYLLVSALLFFVCSTFCFAQQKRKSFMYDKHGNPSFYTVTSFSASIRVSLRVDSFTKAIEPFNSIPNQPLTNLVYLEGTKEISLSTLVHQDSISFYRYSLIENDTRTIVNQATPDKIAFRWPPKSSQPKLVTLNLGSYQIENKKLQLEVYKTSEKHKVSTVIFYNKPIRPAQIFLIYPYVQLKKGRSAVDMGNLPSGVTLPMADNLKGILVSIRNTDLNFIYQVFLKNKATGETTALANNWLYDFIQGNPYQIIEAKFFRDKGDYEISIMPVLSTGMRAKPFPEKATVFRFTIQKEIAFTQTEIAFMLVAVIGIAGLVIGSIKVRSNQKLTEAKRQKEVSQLQLNLVRSQLNPHFMFNALAGIQNLMNQNDAANANRYLSKFARLTRHILKNEELITLQEEISLIEDYLQMEQLRFGFKYAIQINDALDVANVEIPAMLLQPFVENAVKHGVASLLEAGLISICLTKNNTDLLLIIQDNGGGFNPETAITGLGLSLTYNRLALLNKMYKSAPITLNIQSTASGTAVTFTLTHWL